MTEAMINHVDDQDPREEALHGHLQDLASIMTPRRRNEEGPETKAQSGAWWQASEEP